MERWAPLSEREGNAPKVLREQVSDALEGPLREWLERALDGLGSNVTRVAVRLDFRLYRAVDDNDEDNEVFQLAYGPSREKLWDVVDAVLDLLPSGGSERTPLTPGMNRLTAALTVAGSLPDVRFRVPLRKLLDDARAAYVIRSDGRALVRRLDPAVGAAVEEALKSADQPERGSASRHLRQAMDLAYALHPDPVKAYSEAIKAVECALHDTLQPNNRKATLGTMKGELPQLQNKLRSAITGPNGSEGFETALKMMTLLWEGQTSRHGARDQTRDETPEAARMAVHLAATLVQWFASGAINKA
ncbi:hypothetical protein OG594_44880 [Streptomyces sp. NBC_01214]|uniref:hypothetical protein n=1 Tax=Streptomyces sp. NBC_01214 TaxID=2903777 RepID=UPI002256CBDB|nr:hypothetical protein [Streptomyces sp. NBC_01214]MCX4808634.1 hypothetical protein [Streptomyces sp. NBC_01214]